MAATENVKPSTMEESPQTPLSSAVDVEHASLKNRVSLWSYLMTDVDPAQTTAPLAAYCFMTGYM